MSKARHHRSPSIFVAVACAITLAVTSAVASAVASLAATAAPAAQVSGSSPDAATRPARYERTAPSTDGIGKRYMGRDIARIMGWQGAEWLERAEREQEERTDLLLRELRLAPGMKVADIGAGTGYISRRIARVLGPTSAVYAVDVQPEMVRMLSAMAQRENLPSIKPVLGTALDVKLAPASIDLAIMVDVYHELEHPHEVLASIVRALKRDGRVVFVEYKAEDPAVPIKPLHKMSIEQVKREATVHPLVLDRVVETLPWQHVIVFRKSVPAAGVLGQDTGGARPEGVAKAYATDIRLPGAALPRSTTAQMGPSPRYDGAP
jgi:ubiquinone/menaquinone biosynthesis C-methylase UbiE